ncbi:uncharacterized protein LOC133905868 isoform X2 [Phragmites australis]|uniref:uncharacterized protein LOC133905868 isoform X2 n=1 Tax=Phragmites australis TaxID=29695 RepID=UPI002D798C27|nr:uncharacterized protein LOC133905868 isoform X2 [Phragmites australis]
MWHLLTMAKLLQGQLKGQKYSCSSQTEPNRLQIDTLARVHPLRPASPRLSLAPRLSPPLPGGLAVLPGSAAAATSTRMISSAQHGCYKWWEVKYGQFFNLVPTCPRGQQQEFL